MNRKSLSVIMTCVFRSFSFFAFSSLIGPSTLIPGTTLPSYLTLLSYINFRVARSRFTWTCVVCKCRSLRDLSPRTVHILNAQDSRHMSHESDRTPITVTAVSTRPCPFAIACPPPSASMPPPHVSRTPSMRYTTVRPSLTLNSQGHAKASLSAHQTGHRRAIA